MKSYGFIIYLILVILVAQSEAAKKWLPAVTGYNKNDSNNGYAGVIGKAITGLRVSGSKPYKVHLKGKGWLPEVTGNNVNDANNGYAGTLNGDAIDAVAIKSATYAVHIQGGSWLPAVTGYNVNDANNGYAGVLGKTIDAIMINGRSYATSYNTSDGPTPPVGDKAQRIKTIYNFFKNNVPGATKNGIAAILGNWDIESGIEPKRAEGDYYNPPIGTANNRNSASYDNDSWLDMTGPQIYNGGYPAILKRGLGLGQWTDTKGSPRNTELRKYAKAKGKKWYDLTLQLDFLIRGDNSYAISIVKDVLTSKDTINNLTSKFLSKWEGVPGNKLQQRQNSATSIYNTYLKNY